MATKAPSLRFGVLTFQALPYADLRADVQFAESPGLDGVQHVAAKVLPAFRR